MINTPTSVIAKALNEQDKQEGTADEELEPGVGAVTYQDEGGDWHVRAAEANEQTTRVVREARDPPMNGIGTVGDSPLDETYDAGIHTFTVGGLRYDRFRVRLSEHASADPADELVGWDVNGYATDDTIDGADPVDTYVGRGLAVIEREEDDDLLLIEVL